MKLPQYLINVNSALRLSSKPLNLYTTNKEAIDHYKIELSHLKNYIKF